MPAASSCMTAHELKSSFSGSSSSGYRWQQQSRAAYPNMLLQQQHLSSIESSALNIHTLSLPSVVLQAEKAAFIAHLSPTAAALVTTGVDPICKAIMLNMKYK